MRNMAMITLALLVLCAGAAWAQTGSITGVVVDRNGDAVEGARVSLHQDDVCVGYVLTGFDGSFTLEDVAPGYYLVKASLKKTGTASMEDVEVIDGQVTDIGTLQLQGKFMYGQQP